VNIPNACRLEIPMNSSPWVKKLLHLPSNVVGAAGVAAEKSPTFTPSASIKSTPGRASGRGHAVHIQIGKRHLLQVRAIHPIRVMPDMPMSCTLQLLTH
jgi:hypothetical protein